jgi:1-acyl-sn-glycerol-3-phosphate acyltransferase
MVLLLSYYHRRSINIYVAFLLLFFVSVSPPSSHGTVQAFVFTKQPQGRSTIKDVPVSTVTRISKAHVARSSQVMLKSTSSNIINTMNVPATAEKESEIHPFKASITKAGMIAYIASMCVALPVTLFPAAMLHKARLISKTRKEKLSLRIGQFCSRWLMRIIPFAKVQVMREDQQEQDQEPSVWVCNHTSMLDIFILLATDKKLRGKNKRPIKIVYWKDLEKNPITCLLFKMCGFFPVEMEANGNGNANQYKKSSFKALLKGIKEAFDEGFDIGILPEGQLNPTPEKGLQPVFPGAFTLSKMSKRPIRMMGLFGLHRLWHGDERIGMTVTGREVKVRAYPFSCKFENADDFVESFKSVVGYFGAKGEDHPDWQKYLTGKLTTPTKIESSDITNVSLSK